MDFTRSRVDDPVWWRRLAVVVGVFDRRSRAVKHQQELAFYLAQVVGGKLEAEAVIEVQAAAVAAHEKAVDCLRPWVAAAEAARAGREFRSNRQAFIDATGADPLDPKFREWEEERVRAVLAGEFDTPDAAASAEAAVLTRLRERAEKQAAATAAGRSR